MKCYFLFFMIFLVASSPLKASFEHYFVSRSVFPEKQTMPLCLFLEAPPSTAQSCIAFHNQKLFGLNALNVSEAAYHKHTANGCWAVGCYVFGDSRYREYTVDTNMPFHIHPQFLLTFTTAVHQTAIIHHQSKTGCTLSLRGRTRLSPQLQAGFLISNLNGCRLKHDPFPLPRNMVSTLLFKPLSYFSLQAACSVSRGYPVKHILTVYVKPRTNCMLSACLSSGDSFFSYGLYYQFNHLGLRYQCPFHSILGCTHAFSVFFTF